MSRAYDYACPSFGGFSVPPSSWDSPSRDFSHRSSNRQALIKQASINNALARPDSTTGRLPMSRVDSLSRVPPLTRADSSSRLLARQDSSSRLLTRQDSSSRLLTRQDSSSRLLTRQDSGPHSPLTRQDSGNSRFETSFTSPATYRPPPTYVDRFRNFNLM